MRHVFRGFLLGSALCIPFAVVGCGGAPEKEVLDYDEEESEKQSAAYEEQMKEAMQQQGRPVQ